MLLLISDSSVLIDIEQGALTRAMFSLPWRFAVPDVLFLEELAEKHRSLLELGLECKSMNGDLIAQTYQLRQQYRQTSVNDLLALILAKAEQGLLLTGDKALRRVASSLNVEVHGTLWLVKQIIDYKKITIEIAAIAFQRMQAFGSRLPWNEVDKLLKASVE